MVMPANVAEVLHHAAFYWDTHRLDRSIPRPESATAIPAGAAWRRLRARGRREIGRRFVMGLHEDETMRGLRPACTGKLDISDVGDML